MAALMTLMLLILMPARATSAELSPESTVQQMFAAFNRHDARRMQQLYASDARLTSSDFCEARGRNDVPRTYQALFEAFPDIHDEVITLARQRDVVAVRFRATSQQGGMSMLIHTFMTVRHGLIVEDDSVFDNGGRPCAP